VDVLTWIIVGLVAGLLASLVMGGVGYGILGDIVLGILGALIGGWLFAQILRGGRRDIRRVHRGHSPAGHHPPSPRRATDSLTPTSRSRRMLARW